MKKDIKEYDYNSPIKKIFSNRTKRSKGGKGTLGQHAVKSPSEAVYKPIKGLSKDEYRQAMQEVKKGYTWSSSRIQPKDDIAKRTDYENLSQEYSSWE